MKQQTVYVRIAIILGVISVVFLTSGILKL